MSCNKRQDEDGNYFRKYMTCNYWKEKTKEIYNEYKLSAAMTLNKFS
jgi:hypothetical protein